MQKERVILFDTTIDILAKMMVGYVLHADKESAQYQKKVEAVIEFLEQVLDPSFDAVAMYLHVLSLLPETTKRKMPFHIEEFIRMYQRQVEEALGGPIQAKYAPKRIITEEKKIILANGSTITVSDGEESDPLQGLNKAPLFI